MTLPGPLAADFVIVGSAGFPFVAVVDGFVFVLCKQKNVNKKNKQTNKNINKKNVNK